MAKNNFILWLDDDPARAAAIYSWWPEWRRNKVIWCQTAEEAILTLQDYELNEVYLGHDLEERKFVSTNHTNTGMEVVRWIEKFKNLEKFANTAFTIHTHNLVAGRQMGLRLLELGLNVKYIPFGHSKEISLFGILYN